MADIAFAADHAGFPLKEQLKPLVAQWGHSAVDLGTDSKDSVDYPDFADRMAEYLKAGQAQYGVLICGTGIGISMAANRHRHIRAALCYEPVGAGLARAHNNANVLCLGGRLIGSAIAEACLETFLKTPFEGGRHGRRVGKFSSDFINNRFFENTEK